MTFDEYQDKAVSTAIYGTGVAVIYPALGLAGEAGEVANKVKKVLRDENGVITQEHVNSVCDEIGDVLWYCAALARDFGISLDDIANRNIEKLAKRKENNTLHGSGDQR